MRHLEQMNHSSRPYLARLLAIAEAEPREPDKARDNLRAAAITAVARRGDLLLADGTRVADRLMALLPEPVRGFSRLAVWRHFDAPAVPEVVRLAVVDAMAVLGDQEDAARLDDDSGEPATLVRERMHKAAAAIRARAGGEDEDADEDASP